MKICEEKSKCPLDREEKMWYNNSSESLKRYRDIGKSE